jgi:defect-in-organelle-trafficking protein DotC
MSDAALSFGAQSGLAWQSARINKHIESHSRELDQVYNFNRLMLKDNLMPPVVQESRNNYHQDNYDTVRLADRVIEIVIPASFVTTPPTWRDYIKLHYLQPATPHSAVLPQDGQQRELWDKRVSEGWHNGTEQANIIFEESLGRLNRDITGMVLYRSLLVQGMISKPYTSTAKLGITGDSNHMRLNDQIVRVTAASALKVNHGNRWKPAVIVDKKGTYSQRYSK